LRRLDVPDSDNEGQWQVTCPCGWRTHGSKSEVVPAVIEHGRTAHEQQLSEAQVMDLAVRLDDV
jgi:predicted small metal-binding protein